MRAKFSEALLNTRDGVEMTSILRACVHCGFCNATCPTYQIQGDELDGPRGRIYLIKSMLEDANVGAATQRHLDRCLTCRSCETTCPSGVRYSRLLDLARPKVDQHVRRGLSDRLQRWLIRLIVPYPARFAALARLGRLFKPFAPRFIREIIPPPVEPACEISVDAHERKMILLEGCVQQAAAPAINAAARSVFDRLTVQLQSAPGAGCCGAVAFHLGETDEARTFARRNIDAWSPALDAGAEAVIATSSGCATMLQEYGELLSEDERYRERARMVAERVCDPSEVIDLDQLANTYQVNLGQPIAFHAPCSLLHGLRAASKVEACLRAVGFELTNVADAHLCCGSAGSYSLLQPKLATELLDKKLIALQADGPATIASANIGCLMHLRRRADIEVLHWLELIRRHAVEPS